MALLRQVVLSTGMTIAFGAQPVPAAEPVRLELLLRDHRFIPAELHAPAGQAIEITLRNEDAAAEEFESSALKVEKIVAAGRQIVIRLRPLAVGRYPFVGEFHAETASGVLIIEPEG